MDYEESKDQAYDKEQCSDEEHCCDKEQSRDLDHSQTEDSKKKEKKERKKPSNQELITSAKVVAEGLQNLDKVDKAKFAHAAEDLLGAASHYGKLDDKGYDKYIDKVEDMLHKYGGSGATHGEGEVEGSEHSNSKKDKLEKDKENKGKSEKEKDGGEDEEGGVGNYLKMAQGIFKKWDLIEQSGLWISVSVNTLILLILSLL